MIIHNKSNKNNCPPPPFDEGKQNRVEGYNFEAKVDQFFRVYFLRAPVDSGSLVYGYFIHKLPRNGSSIFSRDIKVVI